MCDTALCRGDSVPSLHSRSSLQWPQLNMVHDQKRDEFQPPVVGIDAAEGSILPLEWARQSFGHGGLPEPAIPRLPSIREILGDGPVEPNARNANPSPLTIADSPGPATPTDHYVHMRHLSWPRARSFDSVTTGPCEDRPAPLGRPDVVDVGDVVRPQEEDECRLPHSPRSRRHCYSPRLSRAPPLEIPRQARALALSHGHSDEPRILPSLIPSTDFESPERKRQVAAPTHRREEDYDVPTQHRHAYILDPAYATQPEGRYWTTSLAVRGQSRNHSNCVPPSERAAFLQRVPVVDTRTTTHTAPSGDIRSRSVAFATGNYRPSGQGHSRALSLTYDRVPALWAYRGNDTSLYQIGASGPSNPFAHPIPLSADLYGHHPAYHLAGHSERTDGSGSLAEMNKRKKRGNLPPEAKKVMNAWFKDHLNHPYPNEETKKKWIAETGLSQEQISNFCINARRRDIKRMRKEAGLSPDIPEPTHGGDMENHRKRRSSEGSPSHGELQDDEPDKRRRRQ